MSAPQSRTILVTGAGSGLGRALCLHLAQAGHRIIVTDRDARAVAGTSQQLAASSRDRDHGALTLDVTSPDAPSLLAAHLGEAPAHVLINNAGLQHVAPLETFPAARWELLIQVMLTGAATLSRACLPGMRAYGYGRIINIGSIHSLVASPFKSAYVAAKHGLLGLAKALALETADTDITVNTICPSYIRTPLVEAQIKDQAISHGISEDEVVQKIMLDPMPKKAFITTQEVSGTIEFLMGAAARNMTGQTLVLDGGWTAR